MTACGGTENVDKIKRGEPVKDPDKIVKARMAADTAELLTPTFAPRPGWISRRGEMSVH